MLSLGQYSIFRRDVSNLKFSRRPFGNEVNIGKAARLEETRAQEITLKLKLKSRGHRLGISVPKEKLISCLGNEPCWVKIKVKGRVLYKEYNPTFAFSLPKGIGSVGEEVCVTIKKISIHEFIRDVFGKNGQRPVEDSPSSGFDIVFTDGGYKLVINTRRRGGVKELDLILEGYIHYEHGDTKGPVVTFVIKDYEENEHVFKIACNYEGRHLFKMKPGTGPGTIPRRIVNLVYNESWEELIVKYYRVIGERTNIHRIEFKEPKAALLDLVRKYEEGPKYMGIIGEIGEGYIRLYKDESVKESVSEKMGIPKDELKLVRLGGVEKPDLAVYRRNEMVAIVEVKTTRYERRIKGCAEEAIKQLHKYLAADEWGKAEYGVYVVVHFKEPDKVISSNFLEGIEIVVKGMIKNPYCQKT
jgi:hypothetical protein